MYTERRLKTRFDLIERSGSFQYMNNEERVKLTHSRGFSQQITSRLSHKDIFQLFFVGICLKKNYDKFVIYGVKQ